MHIDNIKNKLLINGAPNPTKILIIDTGCNINSNNITKHNIITYESDKDYANHGTIITKIITTINPQAIITSIKAVDQARTIVSDKLNQALMYAHTGNYDLINISLGLPNYNQTTQDLINSITASSNTRIICAAGNHNALLYPALYDNTVSVGSLNDDNTIAPYSAQAQVYTYGSIIIGNKEYIGTSYSAGVITAAYSLIATNT